MPFLSDVTVIDIGSKSICAYRAERLSEDNFSVKSSFEMEYSGYMTENGFARKSFSRPFRNSLTGSKEGAAKSKASSSEFPRGFARIASSTRV